MKPLSAGCPALVIRLRAAGTHLSRDFLGAAVLLFKEVAYDHSFGS